MTWQDQASLVADIVRASGGSLTGRTKLQKTVYIIQAAGWGSAFTFRYFHYGPYSETLAEAAENACLLNLIKEEKYSTSNGNPYSVYETVNETALDTERSSVSEEPIRSLIQTASKANAIELELAATALYLAKEEQCKTPWRETERRKPQKSSNGLLDRAKALYVDLRRCAPEALPELKEA